MGMFQAGSPFMEMVLARIQQMTNEKIPENIEDENYTMVTLFTLLKHYKVVSYEDYRAKDSQSFDLSKQGGRGSFAKELLSHIEAEHARVGEHFDPEKYLPTSADEQDNSTLMVFIKSWMDKHRFAELVISA